MLSTAPSPTCDLFSRITECLAAERSLAKLVVLAWDLVWQLVIYSPCIHGLGRVLLIWAQGTLTKGP